jgi:transposase InsO family protein
MRAHVHRFVDTCPMCQKLSLIRPAIQATRFTTMVYEPMERINLDHMGPFPTDEFGNTHVLAIIDVFTRWIELYSVKSTQAEETADCLLQHIGRFGSPLQILSDNGPA